MASSHILQRLAQTCSQSKIRASPRASAAAPYLQSTSFSTSSSYQQPMPMAKTKGTAQTKKGQKAFAMKKKRGSRPEKKRRTPAGAYRELKKKIVLSNTNALPVEGLKQLNRDALEKQKIEGRVMELSDPLIDKLRAAEAFKPTQGWSSFRHPCVLMTEEAVKMAEHIKRIGQPILNPEMEAETMRSIVVGERASGKSMLLLQSMAAAFLKGWIVINLPEARDIVDANTAYYPRPQAYPVEYVQKDYMAHILTQMNSANAEFFSKTKTKQEHDLAVDVPVGTPLTRLCQLGTQTPENAWQMFQAIWSELTSPNSDNPPILLTLDGLGDAMSLSQYIHPDLSLVHAHELSIIKLFVSYLSGEKTLSNGGLVLAATTNSYAPPVPALDYAIKVNEARMKGETLPKWDPYTPSDPRVTEALKEIDVIRMRGLTKDEARTILNYYAASGMLRHTVNEEYVSHNWTLAGGGIIGELERAAVKMGVSRI